LIDAAGLEVKSVDDHMESIGARGEDSSRMAGEIVQGQVGAQMTCRWSGRKTLAVT
jgi:hypothetical protein